MSNPYYTRTGFPTPNAPGSSAAMRNELDLIMTGFDKLPTLTGNAFRVVAVNQFGTALVATSSLQSLAITGSTINNTVIGGTTPAAGTFTTILASGNVVLGSSVTIAGGTINNTPVGNTTPSTGAFTTLSASSGITGNLTGNVTGNLTGNVTGNLTGNVTGNITANSGTSTFNNVTINGTLDMDAGSTATIINLSTPVNNGDATPKSYVDTQRDTRLALAGGTMTGAIAMGTNRITGLGDPVNAQDAATKIYVDNAVQGLDAKASVRVATTGNISLSGTQTIDGVAVQVGNRVLVKDQSAAAENGIYVVASGSWTRAADADTFAELVSAFTFVEQGTTNGDNGFVCTVVAGGTLGTTPITWVQFSGAGQIDAGAGLTKTGNQLNVGTASSARIVVNADNIDLATTGIVAGTYRSVTIDQWGRATAGTNPTTLAGYAISDAYTQTQTDNLLALKLNLTGGTLSGNLAMGSNAITGLADPTNAQDAATKNYIDTIFGSTQSASASASAAAQSELNAANSASAASGSASAAAGSASAALASEQAAAASYDSFDDRYLGAKSVAPTVDNDGDPLIIGALYFNTVTNSMQVFGSNGWTAAGSSVNGTSRRFRYIATAGQTSFSGTDSNGSTLAYDAGFVDVYLNGVRLDQTDFTASTGTSVVLASGAAINDELNIVAFGTFSVATHVAKSGDTMTGQLTLPALQVNGNAAYTGTLTGGTGIIDIGSGQIYKDASGNVGIGTNDPKARLHAVASLVSGATYRPSAPFVMERDGDCELQIIANEANISQVRFGNGLTNFAGAISYNHLSNELLIFTNGVSRHRIASDGAQSSVIPGGSVLLPEFKCRAWVNFDGTGTPSIRASGNVSSITRNGTGQYTVNFATALPDANYAVTTSGSQAQSGDHVVNDSSAGFMTTTSVRIATWTFNGGAANDTAHVYVAIHR